MAMAPASARALFEYTDDPPYTTPVYGLVKGAPTELASRWPPRRGDPTGALVPKVDEGAADQPRRVTAWAVRGLQAGKSGCLSTGA